MNDIQIHISNIKEKVQEKMHHLYLVKSIPYPVVDEDKILLLYSVLEPLSISKEIKEQYILSTMLVQIALDTHEEVIVHNNMDEEQFKSQQLTVLAGDFFSGLYFQLLANLGDIPMIKTLAHSIKEINEHKITFYQNEVNKIDDLFDCVLHIESSLIQSVTEFVKETTWKDLSGKILLLKRLIHERQQYISNVETLLIQNVIKHFSTNKDTVTVGQDEIVVSILNKEIEKLWQSIQLHLKEIPNTSFLQERLYSFANDLPFLLKK